MYSWALVSGALRVPSQLYTGANTRKRNGSRNYWYGLRCRHPDLPVNGFGVQLLAVFVLDTADTIIAIMTLYGLIAETQQVCLKLSVSSYNQHVTNFGDFMPLLVQDWGRSSHGPLLA